MWMMTYIFRWGKERPLHTRLLIQEVHLPTFDINDVPDLQPSEVWGVQVFRSITSDSARFVILVLIGIFWFYYHTVRKRTKLERKSPMETTVHWNLLEWYPCHSFRFVCVYFTMKTSLHCRNIVMYANPCFWATFIACFYVFLCGFPFFFVSFFELVMEKYKKTCFTEKKWFRLANGVRSTCSLVKIHNNHFK